jgi:hypothetical protein
MLVSDLHLAGFSRAYLNVALLGLGDALWRAAKRMYGGYWAGGRLVITPQRLLFKQTPLNRALTAEQVGIEVPISDISSVTLRRGLWGHVLDVTRQSSGERLSFHCWDDKKAAW